MLQMLTLVIHRIGGLEMLINIVATMSDVTHRIGGLEI